MAAGHYVDLSATLGLASISDRSVLATQAIIGFACWQWGETPPGIAPMTSIRSWPNVAHYLFEADEFGEWSGQEAPEFSAAHGTWLAYKRDAERLGNNDWRNAAIAFHGGDVTLGFERMKAAGQALAESERIVDAALEEH